MKTSLRKTGFLFALITLSFTSLSQTAYKSTALDIRLAGTSNIHDWEMKSTAGISQATFVVNANGKVTSPHRRRTPSCVFLVINHCD